MEPQSLYDELADRVIAIAERDGAFITHCDYVGWYAKLFHLDGSSTESAGPCLQERSAIALCAIKYLEDKE